MCRPDLGWYVREVLRQFEIMHRTYYSDVRTKICSGTAIDRYARPVARFCRNEGINPKHYVEAQFYCLSEFFKKRGLKRFPLRFINVNDDSIRRYNEFIAENRIKTGSYGISEKDLVNSSDTREEALLKFATEYLRFGSLKLAKRIAIGIDPEFKVREDVSAAVNALYSLCPSVVPYIKFDRDWKWVDLRNFLVDLGIIEN